MKVKIKFSTDHSGYNAKAGDVREIENSEAIWLQAQGIGSIEDGIKEPTTTTVKNESKTK